MTIPDAPRLIEVTDAGSDLFAAAFEIYETTIPRAEQKTRAQILAGLSRPDVRFWACVRGQETLGVSIVYANAAQNILLLEYLAVSPRAQGGGLGSALFSASFEASRFDADTTLLVEVDSESDDVGEAERAVRIKRKQFYRRLGCREVEGFDYILPLDHYGPAPRMNLLILGAGSDRIGTEMLRPALTAIYRDVYGCRSDDPRIAAMFQVKAETLRLI